jgi:hypothetical protein
MRKRQLRTTTGRNEEEGEKDVKDDTEQDEGRREWQRRKRHLKEGDDEDKRAGENKFRQRRRKATHMVQSRPGYICSESLLGVIFWAPEGPPEWSPAPSRPKLTLRAGLGAQGRPREGDLGPPGPPKNPEIP